MKLWSGRFNQDTNYLTDLYNKSISFDIRLLPYDIEGTIAHATALVDCQILSESELTLITEALMKLKQQYEDEEIIVSASDEDVHMLIERYLTNELGDLGAKIHTGRSRNDQVACATRLYCRQMITKIINELDLFNWVLSDLRQEHLRTLMPGTTHLQGAQVITLGYYFDAYIQMFQRDIERLEQINERVNVSPLGSGALAGTTYPLNREIAANYLGFNEVCQNAMDGVSDRDYVIELIGAIALIGVHMSKLAEEIILFNSSVYQYVELADEFATGSSIMPQKKNPDIAELTRGKSARLIGNLVQILTLIKGTPLAYNKDFQEDKEQLFDSVDTILLTLQVFRPMLLTAKFNRQKMLNDCQKAFLNATDLADYLVTKGLPFRQAHSIVGQIVAYAEKEQLRLEQIDLKTYQSFSELIAEDVYSFIDLETTMLRRQTIGAPAWLIKKYEK